MARKSEYKSDYAVRLARFADQPQSLMVRGRLSDARVGAMLGVSRESVRRWRALVGGRENEFKPDFSAAWEACQAAIDVGAIKRSMVERATGFVQKKVVRVADEEGALKVLKEEKVRVAGDVAAAKLVLANIDQSPQRWNTADKTDNIHNVSVDGLTELLTEIDGHGRTLPCGATDGRSTGGLLEGSDVAAQSSVLDH